ncbi:hypothetical protein [Streptomyces sp. NPDC051561]|uniref:hypothetical protein n=1 Tax=Streptomyces sp. NPDC051561 TaxID=3365658 RepID=UPI003790EBF4
MYDKTQELRTAVARCQAVERVLVDAQQRYRQAQEEAARAEAERVATLQTAAREKSTLMALLAQQESAVAEFTAVLERQVRPPAAPPRTPDAE